MNENSASSKKKPTPAIVAASVNTGKQGRANGKSQREDNRGGHVRAVGDSSHVVYYGRVLENAHR